MEPIERELWDSPARIHILGYLSHANDLGFDTDDPDIIRRAITAGTAQYERELSREASTSGLHESAVYYMATGDLVKIGTSINVVARLGAVGAERLLAMEPGDTKLESERHREFAATRNHGEWFRRSPELDAHIEQVRGRFLTITGLTVEEWFARHSPRPRRHTSWGSRPTPSPGGRDAEESPPPAELESAAPTSPTGRSSR